MAMGLSRVFDILDIEPDIEDEPDAKPLIKPEKEISFENINFEYESGIPVLEGVSFTAKPGTITAIIGPTGSGKTTLMSLLLRLYEPSSGLIKIDGTPLNKYLIASLREKAAIALQENVLFSLSVRDNIRYVAPEADDSTINQAIEIACMDEYVHDLPQGLDTVLSDRGGKLSTGQRQRLSIARAVVRNTPILILDEPTAALDAVTEQQVMKNLSMWGKDRVIFLITHRISTIRRADNILYLDQGKILENGTHEELMRNENGKYKAFVQAESNLTNQQSGEES
jgi:ATP-binding cassette subfamily B protein